MRSLRDLLKHTSIYGIGQILSRLASVLLLPLYTRCLTPSDYGCIAILDVAAGVAAILLGAGMAAAVTRHHFDTEDPGRDRVWWTGLTYVALMAAGVISPLCVWRRDLAHLLIGSTYVNGGYLVLLAALTMWFSTLGEVLDAYLRVYKRSGLYVTISVGRLLLNVGLNVFFLVRMQMGVAGLLTGNLIAGAAGTLAQYIVFSGSRDKYSFDFRILRDLLRFGLPLIVTALLSLLMHEADRVLLRTFLGMDQVGVYSLAYKIGHAVNTLCLLPFGAIWGVVLYEIAQQDNAKETYGRVFEYFVSGLIVVLLAASLFVHPVWPIIAAEGYAEAADLVPVVLLAFLFFSMHSQFSVPALLAKRTTVLIPASLAGVIVNIAGNVLLIPILGVYGAAWASVLTYAAFSFVGLALYRRIDTIPYPCVRILATGAGAVVTYLAVRFGCYPYCGPWRQLGIALATSIAWLLIVAAPELRAFAKQRDLRISTLPQLASRLSPK